MSKKFDSWMKNGSNVLKVKSLYTLRPYHNWRHIEKCLSFFDKRLQPHVTDELLFAIVYHDSIYNSSSNTNEEDSVSLAKLDLSGLGLNLNKISDLILSTKHHYHTTFADDDETQCMIDVDLSILGSPRDEYIEYSQSIREEYLFINYQTFSAARIDFLQKMLSRKQIFHKLTELESVARTNLYDEIVHLSR